MLSHSSCSGSALRHDSAIDSTVKAENLAIESKLLGQLENLERSQNFPALKKNRQLLKNAANTAQFASPVTEETYSEAGKRVVPANTKQCSSWALQNIPCLGCGMKQKSARLPTMCLVGF